MPKFGKIKRPRVQHHRTIHKSKYSRRSSFENKLNPDNLCRCIYSGGSQQQRPGAATPWPAAGAVADMRISYERGGLEEVDYKGRDPITVFDEWFKDAVEQKVGQRKTQQLFIHVGLYSPGFVVTRVFGLLLQARCTMSSLLLHVGVQVR